MESDNSQRQKRRRILCYVDGCSEEVSVNSMNRHLIKTHPYYCKQHGRDFQNEEEYKNHLNEAHFGAITTRGRRGL